jgi:hypothetical protein
MALSLEEPANVIPPEAARGAGAAAPARAAVRPAAPVAEAPPQATAAKPEAVAKQPWDMTKDEFEQWSRELRAKGGMGAPNKYLKDNGLVPVSGDGIATTRPDGNPLSWHEIVVAKALSEGKPVPEAVLRDYPDMAAKAAPTPPQDRIAAPEDYLEVQRQKLAKSVGDALAKPVEEGQADRSKGVLSGPLDPAIIIGAVRNVVEKVNQAGRGGRFRASYSVDKEAGDLVNRLAASKESAETASLLASRYVLKDLSPNERDLFQRYLLDQRAQALEAQGITQHNVPKLSAGERVLVQNAPKVQAAIVKHMGGPQEAILQKRLIASPSMAVTQTPEGAFVSLMMPEDGAGTPPTAGGSVASRLRRKGTRFAKQATGQAAEYETDYPTILRNSFNEVTQKANMRTLYDTLKAKGLGVAQAPNKPLPATIDYNGKTYDAKPIEFAIGRDADGNTINMRMAVPDPIWRDLNDVLLPKAPRGGLYSAASQVSTALALATPAELVSHTWRVLNAAAAMPQIGERGVLHTLENLVPWAGPRMGTLYRMYNTDLSLPENAARLQRIMDANAGSNRAFSQFLQTRIPVLGKLQNMSHDALFAVPEGKGLKGFDLRVRMVMEALRERIEGNQDPQRTRDFLNQFGQYTAHPDHVIERMRMLNPYAATTLPLRATEFKQLIGETGLEPKTAQDRVAIKAESLWRGTVGTIAAAVMLNKALSGHYPWENKPGHEFDIEAGKDADGQPIYVSGSRFAPTISRPLKSVGIPQAVETMRTPTTKTGQASKREVGLDVLRGIANASLQTVTSPLSNLMLGATTGKAPYFTQGGELLTTAPKADKAQGEQQWRQNVLSGLAQVNPFSGRILNAEPTWKHPQYQAPLWKVMGYGELLAGNILKKDALAGRRNRGGYQPAKLPSGTVPGYIPPALQK